MTSEGFTGAGSTFLLQEVAEWKNDPLHGVPGRVFHLFPPVSIRALAPSLNPFGGNV